MHRYPNQGDNPHPTQSESTGAFTYEATHRTTSKTFFACNSLNGNVLQKTFALPLDKKKFMPLPLSRVKHQTLTHMNNFPTLGAAVLYLNGFHHGEHIACLNGLARTEPKWVMRVANIVWDNRDKGYTPTFHEHAWLLGFGVKDYNTQA